VDSIALAIVSLLLSLVAILNPPVETKEYRNCSEMRQDFPNGVKSSHPAYKLKLDRDRDGVACE
jgi:hypothetical protein